MGLILQLETSTEVCSVAVSDSGTTISLAEAHESNSHTEKLTLLIDECLKKQNIHIKDITAVCISSGPGSYTSLRVGASVAKGLCFALDIPLLAIDSLEILIEGVNSQKINEGDHIIPMIDARRQEVYTAIFDATKNRMTDTQALILEESLFDTFKNNPIHLCGNGAPKYYEGYYSEQLRLHHTDTSSSFMSQIAWDKFKNHHYQDIAYYNPNYLKSPNITKSLKNLFR